MTSHDSVSKIMRQSMRVAFVVAVLAVLAAFSSAQEPESTQPEQEGQQPAEVSSPSVPTGPRTTVHGVVRNGASGEPLPRALVRISGDAATGALTDGDGRFEIPNVPVGPQEFEVLKPGFMDQADAGAGGPTEEPHGFAHNVIVVAGMTDIVFAMARINSIRGVIQLSTGEPAHAIHVTLLKRTIQDGRVVWQSAGAKGTNSEGAYRFGGLEDGEYALYTDPTMESEAATDLVEPGRGRSVARGGYASQFYPDARDLAGAAKIRLAGGEQAQADMTLTLEPFHLVAATVGLPSPDRAGSNFSFMVLDAGGHQLSYSAQYDPNTHTMQTMLPDGAYSLVAIATRSRLPGLAAGSTFTAPGGEVFTGQIDVSVAGHAVSNLRIPLAAARTSPVQVSVMRTGVAAAQPGESGSTVSSRESGVNITVSQTGAWISDGMVMSFAQGGSSGPLESSFVSPGAYWVHTNIAQKGLCESSFTAGGAGLAHEPLVLGSSGATVPLTLALRDDCASLTLALPASMSVPRQARSRFTRFTWCLILNRLWMWCRRRFVHPAAPGLRWRGLRPATTTSTHSTGPRLLSIAIPRRCQGCADRL